jgi:hypothetical protein
MSGPATPAPTPVPNGLTPEQEAAMQAQTQAAAAQNAQMQQLLANITAVGDAGPQLQYNPIKRMVKKADGTTEPVDANYVPKEGESIVGQLQDEYKMKGGDSITQALLQKQGLEESGAMDKANRQGQQALQNANASLGMRGGLNQQNRANLARSNMRDSLMANQDVAKQGMSQRMDIQNQGQQMNRDADKQNLGTLLTSIGGVNQFDLEKYKQQMAVQAANKQADATSHAGGGGKK